LRDYAKIAPTFWTGQTGRELKKKGTEAVVVAMYLLTSPHSNMLGLYFQPVLYIAEETGMTIEGASKGLQWCIEAQFCSYDEESKMVWVHEMAAWQIAEALSSGDKRCKGIQKDYDSLQENPFLARFFDRYSEAFHMTAKRGGKADKKKPLRRGIEGAYQAPTKQGEGEGEGEGVPPTPKGEVSEFPPGFDRFWSAYPCKKAKTKAIQAFARLRVDEALLVRMLAAIAVQAASEDWRKSGGQFVPHAATWLNGKRWEDEVGPAKPSADPFAGAL
jgi:hypothetical protein